MLYEADDSILKFFKPNWMGFTLALVMLIIFSGYFCVFNTNETCRYGYPGAWGTSDGSFDTSIFRIVFFASIDYFFWLLLATVVLSTVKGGHPLNLNMEAISFFIWGLCATLLNINYLNMSFYFDTVIEMSFIVLITGVLRNNFSNLNRILSLAECFLLGLFVMWIFLMSTFRF